MALTELQIQARIDSYLQANRSIPASEHNEIETALNTSLVNQNDFQELYDAASKGASYFFNTNAEMVLETGASVGERCLVRVDENEGDVSTIYQMSAVAPPSQWSLVGPLITLGAEESTIVTINGTQSITGEKTFTSVPPKLDATSHALISNNYDITDKLYVDTEIASAETTVSVSATDNAPNYLNNKVTVTANAGLTTSIDNSPGDEDLLIELDITNATDKVTPIAADEILLADSADTNAIKKADIGSISSAIDHDATTNFVLNEHINHTSVTLTAGSGLSGTGDISANRTFDVDINSEAAIPYAASGDEILISDLSDSNSIKKVTVNNLLSSKIPKVSVLLNYNTLNDAIATGDGYIMNEDLNNGLRQLVRLNDGGTGKTYTLTKANFRVIDPAVEVVGTPTAQIHKNEVTVSGAVFTNLSSSVDGTDNDLTTNIVGGTTFTHGDYVDVYIGAGHGTSSGSQIYYLFEIEFEEVV